MLFVALLFAGCSEPEPAEPIPVIPPAGTIETPTGETGTGGEFQRGRAPMPPK
jgi:hypothetical protein